jgi:hypothetical protein
MKASVVKPATWRVRVRALNFDEIYLSMATSTHASNGGGKGRIEGKGGGEAKKQTEAGTETGTESASSQFQFDRSEWKASRVRALAMADETLQLLARNRVNLEEKTENFDFEILILDDNFHLRSMRYPFFQLARKCAVTLPMLCSLIVVWCVCRWCRFSFLVHRRFPGLSPAKKC